MKEVIEASASPPFSWKRALRFGLIPLALIFLASILLIALNVVADPERMGEGAGRLGFFAYLGGLGVSYLRQSGYRRVANGISGLFLLALGVGTAVLAQVDATGGLLTLSPTDRAPLVVEGEGDGRRLVHSALGFSLAHPGPGFILMTPEMAGGKLESGPSTVTHGYLDQGTGRLVMVGLVSITGLAPDGMGRFLDQIRGGFEESYRASQRDMGALQVVARRVDERAGEAEQHLRLGDMIDMIVHAWSLKQPDRTLLIQVTTVGMTAEASAALFKTVKFSPPR